jgi:hypothetical protein
MVSIKFLRHVIRGTLAFAYNILLLLSLPQLCVLHLVLKEIHAEEHPIALV